MVGLMTGLLFCAAMTETVPLREDPNKGSRINIL